jgi:hypothetical protein
LKGQVGGGGNADGNLLPRFDLRGRRRRVVYETPARRTRFSSPPDWELRPKRLYRLGQLYHISPYG